MNKLRKSRFEFFDKPVKVWSLWPIYVTFAFSSLLYSAIIINMANIAEEIIWVGDSVEEHIIEIGTILSARNVMWAFSGIIFGFLADRSPRKILLILTTVLVGISSILFSRFPRVLGQNLYYYFLITNSLMGLGLGAFRPIIHSYTKDALENRRISRFFGIYSAVNLIFMPIGMILAAFFFNNESLTVKGEPITFRTFFGSTGVLILS